jgi:hypothetical protein
MTFSELYYAIHEQFDNDTLYRRARNEVQHMSGEMFAAWVEYCNRSIKG